jgi:hypothetical protein
MEGKVQYRHDVGRESGIKQTERKESRLPDARILAAKIEVIRIWISHIICIILSNPL